MTNTIDRLLTAIAVLACSTLGAPTRAHAHGTMLVPESRIHRCAFDGSIESHPDPACRAAVDAGGKQALYDWNGVRQGAADGRHREVVPDGELCSGGNPDFAGLALARADWRTRRLIAGADGGVELVWHATAPHATRDWQFYLTRDGWDPTELLRWDDVERFCTSGAVPLETDAEGRQVYRIRCPLPERRGRHVLFAIWQRSDSPEAFYSCSDVELAGGNDAGWVQIGTLVAHERLRRGTRIAFRLFDESGADLERIEVYVASKAAGAKRRWPALLARSVNRESAVARIGVLTPEGTVVPSRTANGNLVYGVSGRALRFEVDATEPGSAPLYPAGIGSYGPGTRVQGAGGGLYECRPFPSSGWCNQAPAYYAPGAGSAWRDAWVRLS
jgi:chitin-binding protein